MVLPSEVISWFDGHCQPTDRICSNILHIQTLLHGNSKRFPKVGTEALCPFSVPISASVPCRGSPHLPFCHFNLSFLTTFISLKIGSTKSLNPKAVRILLTLTTLKLSNVSYFRGPCGIPFPPSSLPPCIFYNCYCYASLCHCFN